jgi:hypothetical protein
MQRTKPLYHPFFPEDEKYHFDCEYVDGAPQEKRYQGSSMEEPVKD